MEGDNDTIYGGSEADTLDGGAGDDILYKVSGTGDDGFADTILVV